jgi:hypothetical protein
MATDTIKSFLVSLGFTTDETSLKKFERGISQATKAVVTLAAAVETTALAVSIGVARLANNLEALYFASQRTGASATNLKAFDRAARDMGASAGEAQSSIEALARFMRDNPGGESIIAGWFGLGSTRDAKGNKLDPVNMALAISKAMQGMPQWQALMLGKQAGFSENTILAMLNPAFAKNFDNVTDRLKRAGFQKAAEDAHRFMEQLRTLGDVLVILGTRVADALQNKLGISLKSITDWLNNNSEWIIGQVTHIAGEFIDSFNAIVAWLTQHGPAIQKMVTEAIGVFDEAIKILQPAMKWLWDELVKLDGATNGWSTRLIVIGGLLKATGAGSIISGVLSLAGAFVTLTGGIAGAVAAGAGLGWLFDKLAPNNWLARFGSALSEKVHDAVDFANAQYSGEKKQETKRPQATAVKMLMNLGMSGPQAAGMVANFQAESGMDPHAQNGSHYGLAQWDKNRQKDFADWAGFDIKDPRADLDKQLHFALFEMFHGKEMLAGDELANAADNAARAGYVVSHYYERSGLDVQDNLRSAAAQRLSSETTINVHGVTDPGQTAKIVANEQERLARLNAELIREFSSSGQ